VGRKKHQRFSFRRLRYSLFLKLKIAKDRVEIFFQVPKYYRAVIKLRECKKSRRGIWADLLELYYRYKLPPEAYYLCRLWEVKKSDWKYYFGSPYREPQRSRLQQKVQPAEYQILFADKSVCEKLCKGVGVKMPRTLGIIGPDQNYKEKIPYLLNQSPEQKFIIKPIKGRGGGGIVLARKNGNEILIQLQNKTITLNEFNLLEESLIQEAILQDKRMSLFSPYSVNTIRVVTMYTKTDFVIIVAALFRCGIGESYVDNWSAGGVAVGIDIEAGKLQRFAYDKNGIRYTEHPTLKVKFENFVIPEWQAIIDLSKKVQTAFSCFRMLGLDIALRENGEPILIEINDVPDLLGQEQMCGPLLKIDKNLRAFGEYDLLINKYQRELYRNLLKKETTAAKEKEQDALKWSKRQ
jgi:hypothetical protein